MRPRVRYLLYETRFLNNRKNIYEREFEKKNTYFFTRRSIETRFIAENDGVRRRQCVSICKFLFNLDFRREHVSRINKQ